MIVSGLSERQLAPQGIHVGYLRWIVDLGTQFNDNFDKASKRVLLHFELSETKAVFKKERGPEPFLVHAEYSKNVGPKSFLRRDIEALLGRKLTGPETASFELRTLFEKPCWVNVMHETSKNGAQYAKILNFTPIPKGTAVPPPVLPTLHYLIEDGTGGVFDQLPDWIQKKILASEELHGRHATKAEIAERNMRQATENALAEQESEPFSGETDNGFDLDQYSDEQLRDPEVVSEVRKLIDNLPVPNAEKANQFRYLNQLVRRAKAHAPDGDDKIPF